MSGHCPPQFQSQACELNSSGSWSEQTCRCCLETEKNRRTQLLAAGLMDAVSLLARNCPPRRRQVQGKGQRHGSVTRRRASHLPGIREFRAMTGHWHKFLCTVHWVKAMARRHWQAEFDRRSLVTEQPTQTSLPPSRNPDRRLLGCRVPRGCSFLSCQQPESGQHFSSGSIRPDAGAAADALRQPCEC